MSCDRILLGALLGAVALLPTAAAVEVTEDVEVEPRSGDGWVCIFSVEDSYYTCALWYDDEDLCVKSDHSMTYGEEHPYTCSVVYTEGGEVCRNAKWRDGAWVPNCE